jgi:intracellular sulfur oxidation DsrE/DsrF family protein
MLKKNTSNVSEEIKQLSGRGVKFLACEFTMQQQKLTKEDMLEGIFYTPYGLIEIITRQENGYHYLKGGF